MVRLPSNNSHDHYYNGRNDQLLTVVIDEYYRVVVDIPVKINAAAFGKRVPAEPATEVGVVGTINRQVEVALRMPVKAGEVEISWSSSEHGR